MSNTLLDGLNPQQRAAVAAGSGPVLVLAGPGSGKTRVLTHRIAYLMREMHVTPEHIVAVTFTNKAAGEMRARVEKIVGGQMRGFQIGTFHSICARLLRREGDRTPFGRDYVIYDTDDQVAVVTQAIGELNIDPKKWSPRRVLGAISAAKNELITADEFRGLDYFGEIVQRVYKRYQAILLDNNALDFDDLLMQMALLLRENDDVRSKYQRLFDFVLVDEFQDTNMAQYELVRIISRPENNVFVVGDEDQGIYAFRGADYRNVQRFRQDYPDAQVILLEQNYRSTQIVLDAARAVIDKNRNRTPKALFTDREGGEAVTIYEAYNEEFEARYIVEKIDELCRKKKYTYNDFAIMYRTNAQSQALESACVKEGIPYTLIGGVGFYKRREIKDLLAYLRLINSASDKISFARIINVPRRGIGDKSLGEFQSWASRDSLTYDAALEKLIKGEASPIAARTARLFADFGLLLQGWRALMYEGKLLEMFDRLTADLGYHLYLREISNTEEETTDREENVDRLRALIADADSKGMPLTEFLEEQSLVADVDALAEGSDAVTLLTLHAAKGLEFPVVFLAGLEEGLLPHSRSFDDPEGMAEERRLMYVGVTRAKDRLFLTYAFKRTLFGSQNANVPSRFLADIPKEITEGLSPKVASAGESARYKMETTWEAPTRATSRTGKVIPFPGKPNEAGTAPSAPPRPNLKYRAGAKVEHPRFGKGMVLNSQPRDGDEEVTVVFEDKKVGIKKIYASFGLKLLE
ncbi:MAG: 3'-5' exonuclease [bacterium]|nr:3'-5' exonuclease [bacterium]